MTSPVSALVIFVVLALSVVPAVKWFIRRRQFIRVIENIPGEKAYPLIGNAYVFLGLNREAISRLSLSFQEKYPAIQLDLFGLRAQVRLKRAELVEKVLMNSKEHQQKPWTYDFIRPWLGDGLILSHGEKRHQRRKMLTPAFHFSILENYLEVMVEKSNVLIQKLRPKAESGESFQMYPFVTRAALEIIGETAMGIVINAQDNTDNKYVASVYECSELIMRRLFLPYKHIDFIYKRTNEGKRFYECLRVMHAFTNDVIAKRKAMRKESRDQNANVIEDSTNKRRPAFLDLLLDANDQSDSILTNDDIRDEVDTFMFGGHDTTTASISWTLYLLGRHPQIQEEVFDEMYSIFGDTERAATIKDLSEMNLLDRVIKETLRLYPPVPIIGRKISEFVRLNDQYSLPAGCNIIVDIVGLHRDPRYFPDPLRFDPDRFLPVNAEGRHPLSYIPFSFGSRNCIGQKFALYEEKVMLSTIIRSYRVKSVGEEELMMKELTTKPFLGIRLEIEKR